MRLRKKKYWVISINSTVVLNKLELASPRANTSVEKSGHAVVIFDYARETFLRVIGLYCRPIFLASTLDLNGRHLSMARYVSTDLNTTQVKLVVFIDPRHLRLRVLRRSGSGDREEAVSRRRRLRRDIARC